MNQEENVIVMKEQKGKPATYSYEEALAASVIYFKGDEMAAKVWVSKYAIKDSAGNIYELTPDDMHRRLAKEVHRIERKYPNPMTEDELFDLIKGFKYIVPQGGPMTGIGNSFQPFLLNRCYLPCHNNPCFGFNSSDALL